MGSTKAEAYRRAYKKDASRNTLVSKPYILARDERVKAEIEAYQAAIEAAKYRTPAALRELVIQSLVSVVINPETKDSVKVAAAKVLGTVTEVAAFTERKEIRTIKSSDDAKAQILGEIKRIISADVTDVAYTETQADDLLRELAKSESGNDEPHPSPTPQDGHNGTGSHEHTIPHERSQLLLDTPPSVLDGSPTLEGSDIGDTPHDGTKG